MAIFTIDRQRCTGDGLCAAVCPRGIIEMSAEGFPAPAAEAERLCISCGHCMAMCPQGALQLDVCAVPERQLADPARLPDREQLRQLIRGRRSIRVYKERPVERALLTEAIDLARHAPTARNSQLLQWLVVDSQETLAELKGQTIDWMRDMMERNDPGALAYGFDDVLRAWDEGGDPILRNAPGLVILHAPAQYGFGLVDSTIAMTTFELAASAMGLGTCWAGFFMIAAGAWQPLRQALDLPQGRVLTTAMMVGYPRYRHAAFAERRPAAISWR